eukprot:15505046-Heterocapsa_arctica.AAC.1
MSWPGSSRRRERGEATGKRRETTSSSSWGKVKTCNRPGRMESPRKNQSMSDPGTTTTGRG